MSEQTASMDNGTYTIRSAQLLLPSPQGPRRFALSGTYRVGSAPNNELQLESPTVSRLHAELRTTEHGVWIRDLGSRNGTRVNGTIVREALIPDRATVSFGAFETSFEYGPTDALPVQSEGRFEGMLGVSPQMRHVFACLARCADSEAPVLLQGETGTGKDLAARAVHQHSRRHAAPFIVVDCAGLLSSNLEMALFGIAADAFGPGTPARPGCFEEAAGGTVFLDEISELPLAVQPRLLRLLEAQSVRRLGDSVDRPLDFRLVVSTQQDLQHLVNRGAFREDLYFRIAALPLVLPPLRDRPDDIPVLARKFLGSRPWPERLALDELMARPWTGNARELKNAIERACAIDSLPGAQPGPPGPPSSHSRSLPDYALPLRLFRDKWNEAGETRYLDALLERAGGKVTKAAELAEVDRTYIYRLIRRRRG